MSKQQTLTNLDYLAAKYAQRIIQCTHDHKPDKVENTITKALGVLQENGIYACFLYLLAKEKDNGPIVVEEMLKLLGEIFDEWKYSGDTRPNEVLSHIGDKITQNLERLLLAKETLEQMLIYARYGAKAIG
ncbi:MAG TPA: hypothetical protein EYP19_14270 [Desulfobacterales bacterium]|nr:hypothetical protein [Desulfobacterales bacterium]